MIYSVQYMRAIASILIVIHHSTLKLAQYTGDNSFLFKVGGAGVDLFFIISGFIMCNTVYKKEVNSFCFLKARVIRIIPLYWVLTSFALIVYMLYPEKVNSSGGTTAVIASYFLWPTGDKFLIANGWTLSYEFLFYFIFSLGLLFKPSNKYLVPLAIIFVLVTLGGVVVNKDYWLFFITNPLLLEFSFGVIAFFLFRTKTIRPLFGFFFILLAIAMLTFVNSHTTGLSRVIEFGLPASLFFLAMLQIEPLFELANTVTLFKAFKENKMDHQSL